MMIKTILCIFHQDLQTMAAHRLPAVLHLHYQFLLHRRLLLHLLRHLSLIRFLQYHLLTDLLLLLINPLLDCNLSHHHRMPLWDRVHLCIVYPARGHHLRIWFLVIKPLTIQLSMRIPPLEKE